MKIAIVGAHRVGKTSLAEALLEHLPGYTLEMEPYYKLEESGYAFSEIPVVDDFLAQIKYSVKQVANGGDNVIFDRCAIDILAYIHAIDKDIHIQSLFEAAQTSIEAINLLVFVPVEVPDLISVTKSDWPKLRRTVNDLLGEWIGDLGVKVIEVSGTLTDRRDQVLSQIDTANRS